MLGFHKLGLRTYRKSIDPVGVYLIQECSEPQEYELKYSERTVDCSSCAWSLDVRLRPVVSFPSRSSPIWVATDATSIFRRAAFWYDLLVLAA